jgi:single-stranded-DNA-specific exonuclease
MEPYGPENTHPVFISRHVTDTGYSRLLKEKHIRFALSQEKTVIQGIGFNMADKFELLRQPVDVIYTLDEQTWNGVKSLQMKVIDLKVSDGNYKVDGI